MTVIYILTVVQERHGEDMKIDSNLFTDEATALASLSLEFDLIKSLAPPGSMAILHGRHFTIRKASPHYFVRGIVQGKVVP